MRRALRRCYACLEPFVGLADDERCPPCVAIDRPLDALIIAQRERYHRQLRILYPERFAHDYEASIVVAGTCALCHQSPDAACHQQVLNGQAQV